ncbi:MAG: trypsin-like peptidase domain-containing protein [Spirochaetaceae bacterium]|jgi:S1-C subfamily serine protease|nr:trypsin-like peptidase domain-containing protein [Spirochaetaceae bacterium]
MKYDSKIQFFLCTALSAVIGAVVAFALFQIKSMPSKTDTTNQHEETYQETDLELRQNPMTTTLRLNTAELQAYSADERSNIAIYDQLNEAVVNITTETQAFNWFLEPVPQNGDSGSGSIIDTNGHVLTNYHVIQNATKVFINLADGNQVEGTVVGVDPENDLAVLSFTPPRGIELKTMPYGDSGNLKVGQKVLAIGNPFAFERTLTVGIVSGLGRPIQTSRRNIIRDMIQTDAAINPGNSGGPLLDVNGKMIGINTMIYSPSGGSAGIGFAVPIDTAKRVVAELIKYGKVRRGWIDGTFVQLFPRLVQYAKLPIEKGLLVSRTRRGGLAERGGLRQGNEAVRYGSNTIYLGGDIIVSVDGMTTDTLADLYSALEDNKPGEQIDVEVLRSGRTVKLTLTLADREETRE